MRMVGKELGAKGWVLRSGGAEGADKAFENGFDTVNGLKEIYLPYKGFNKSSSPRFHVCKEALQLASEIHPNWPACTSVARLLHARNTYQVLGQGLDRPSDVLLYWCEDEKVGGTRTALKLAERWNVPRIKVITVEQSLLQMRELGLC